MERSPHASPVARASTALASYLASDVDLVPDGWMTLCLAEFGGAPQSHPIPRFFEAGRPADDGLTAPAEVIARFERAAFEDAADRAQIDRSGLHPTIHYTTNDLLEWPVPMAMRFERVSPDELVGICLYRDAGAPPFPREAIARIWHDVASRALVTGVGIDPNEPPPHPDPGERDRTWRGRLN